MRRLWDGITEPSDVDGREVAGRMETDRIGCVAVQDPAPFLVVGDDGKICVCAGVRRQLAWMTVTRIVWIRSW